MVPAPLDDSSSGCAWMARRQRGSGFTTFRLPGVSQGHARGDFFDRARTAAAVALLVSAAALIVGSLLDWVTITPAGVPRGNFPGPVDRAASLPFSGIDARDGWWTLGAGAVIAICAVLLV